MTTDFDPQDEKHIEIANEVKMELARDAVSQDEEEPEVSGLARIPYNFLVRNEQDAALVVGAIQLRRSTAQRVRQQAEAMATQAERSAEWLERQFSLQLEQYTRDHITGKTRSVTLLTGQSDKPARMGFRHKPARLSVVDDEQAVSSAPSTEYIQTKITNKPISAKYQEHFEKTGEILPGCELIEEQDKFYIS